MSESAFEISFKVVGVPRPGGSKRHVGGGKFVDASGSRGELWRRKVAKAASQEMSVLRIGKIIGPIELHVEFHMPRPKSHFRLGGKGTLKDNAPIYHLQKPDATKLLRSVEDALNNVAWRDDVQVSDIRVVKRWAMQMEHDDISQIGAKVTISPGQAQERLKPEPIEKF